MSDIDKEVIDIWCNLFTEEGMTQYANSPIQKAAEVFNNPNLFLENVHSPSEFVATMDAYGIGTVLIPAFKFDTRRPDENPVDISCESIFEICREYPNRFRGVAGVHPERGMDGVRELETAVEEYGFVGATVDPFGFQLPPNHRKYYPFYTKCAELDIPVIIHVGLEVTDRPNWLGRPIYIEDIAIDFPDLDIVAAHTGWPWTTELISLAWSQQNVYIGTTGYAPDYWDDELVRFIRSRGRSKVMWGTNYPVVRYGRSLVQIDDLALSEDVLHKLMYENAERVFDL